MIEEPSIQGEFLSSPIHALTWSPLRSVLCDLWELELPSTIVKPFAWQLVARHYLSATQNVAQVANNRVLHSTRPHMKPAQSTPVLLDLPKIIKLSRGLLGTMRLLKSRSTSDCTSTGELLAMQRFFREFEDWIKQLDHWQQEQSGLRATLRRRHLQHRSARQGGR